MNWKVKPCHFSSIFSDQELLSFIGLADPFFTFLFYLYSCKITITIPNEVIFMLTEHLINYHFPLLQSLKASNSQEPLLFYFL